MTEHVAKTLCRAAAADNRCDGRCPYCDPTETEPFMRECSLWPTFVGEARCAIEAVRDYARLDMRRKPRERTARDIVLALLQ